jgi:hypothetical protein
VRVATFGLDESLEAALASSESAGAVRCAPPEEPGRDPLPAALEAAESALESSGASAAAIGGDGDWALAAALACAKEVIPYAHVRPAAPAGRYGGHVERLATLILDEPAATAAAIQQWLTDLGDS